MNLHLVSRDWRFWLVDGDGIHSSSELGGSALRALPKASTFPPSRKCRTCLLGIVTFILPIVIRIGVPTTTSLGDIVFT